MGAHRMVHLVSVHDSFHAQVIAARLGSDGIVTDLRGAIGGPYPVHGEVQVYVNEDDFDIASQLLLADEVEAVFDPAPPPLSTSASPLARLPVWVPIAAIVLLACMALTRGL